MLTGKSSMFLTKMQKARKCLALIKPIIYWLKHYRLKDTLDIMCACGYRARVKWWIKSQCTLAAIVNLV